MEKSSVEEILRVLNEHRVRYLIVGGLAVVAHGYVRFTADVDLVLAFDEMNLRESVAALRSLRYQPRAPVPIDDFIDPAKREQWIREKHLTVFSLSSPAHPATEIDLFVEPPFDFDLAYSKSLHLEVAPGISATFCSLSDLINLKSKANRPIDREDIAQLQQLLPPQESP